MKVATKTRVCTLALTYLARCEAGRVCRVAEMENALGVPRGYLEQLLGGMVRAGFLGSRRGPRGGYFLQRDPATIRVLDVLEHHQGMLTLNPGAEMRTPDRSRRGACAVEIAWREMERQLRRVLGAATIADLAGTR